MVNLLLFAYKQGQNRLRIHAMPKIAWVVHAVAVHVEAPVETRSEIAGSLRRIVIVDSAALVEPADAGQIVVTASHGGLIGGYPPAALKVDAFAAVFNDAGMGAENCGITRLPALQARGIAGLTVAAMSARIGEARSTFHDGVVSAVNAVAASLGARVGDRLEPLLLRWARGG